MRTLQKILTEAALVSVERLSDDESRQMDDVTSGEFDDVDEPDQLEDTEDPDRQGMIRKVPNAHLVYKRKSESNQFTELWVYKQDIRMKKSLQIYDAIIAGTDIPKGSARSEDGQQSVVTWEIGPPANTVTFVEITGLSN